MRISKTANAKFNAVYKELKIALADCYTDFEILEATRAFLDIQKDDVAHDRAITRDYNRISELDFATASLGSIDGRDSLEHLSVLDSNEIDGMFVPDSHIMNSVNDLSFGIGG